MIGKALAGAAGIIAAPVVGGLAWRAARQRRVAKALEIRTPNRIVEQRFVTVGGIDQWIQLRGEDRDNPVLLVLHGGPGWPNAVFTLPLRPWERHFTIVQWDHRGTAKTLRRTGKTNSGPMTLDRRVTDLYVTMAANEAHKYQLTLERLRAAGNPKGVAALEQIGADPGRWDLAAWNTNMAWAFQTNLPTPRLDRRLLFPLALSSPLYSLRDLASLFQGFQWSTGQMFAELMAYDAWRLGLRFEVPFFLFQGEQDVITLTTLAEDYFAEVEAPTKGLALIRDAGHFAAFTQPKRFLAELLTRVHPLTAVPSPSSMREP
jgi:pimeloyl-ACP methyl ester carboxylesterase